jgi:hypothetical protein
MTQAIWSSMPVAPADVLAGIIAADPLDDVAIHAFPASRGSI